MATALAGFLSVIAALLAASGAFLAAAIQLWVLRKERERHRRALRYDELAELYDRVGQTALRIIRYWKIGEEEPATWVKIRHLPHLLSFHRASDEAGRLVAQLLELTDTYADPKERVDPANEIAIRIHEAARQHLEEIIPVEDLPEGSRIALVS